MKTAVLIAFIILVIFTIFDWVTDKEKNWLSRASDLSKIIMGILLLSMFYDSIDDLIPSTLEIILAVGAFAIITIEIIINMVKTSKKKKMEKH